MTRIAMTLSTGRRPITAMASFKTFRLQGLPEDALVVGRWDEDHPVSSWHPATVIDIPGGTRPQVHNAALDRWLADHHGALPDYWFIADDDVVPCRDWWRRMIAVVDADETIGLLGAWNDGSQRAPTGGYLGWDQLVAGEVVQYGGGVEFNVGGALCCVPKRTLQTVGRYDNRMGWVEDTDFTIRIHQAGLNACIARTINAVVLNDDGVDPHYRSDYMESFQRSAIDHGYANPVADRGNL